MSEFARVVTLGETQLVVGVDITGIVGVATGVVLGFLLTRCAALADQRRRLRGLASVLVHQLAEHRERLLIREDPHEWEMDTNLWPSMRAETAAAGAGHRILANLSVVHSLMCSWNRRLPEYIEHGVKLPLTKQDLATALDSGIAVLEPLVAKSFTKAVQDAKRRRGQDVKESADEVKP